MPFNKDREKVLFCVCVADAPVLGEYRRKYPSKQIFRRWLRQRKIFLVEYLSTLPAKNFLFLASAEISYFLGFFRHQHPSVAPLQ
ncbi:hypothetical protein, partial [uncultured Desulfovibrio sp.]|uniref:hypothetical protein n=1 Tax=uncultured Desulfovibrio sp. TaxID=167968 RepID=UPI00262A653A